MKNRVSILLLIMGLSTQAVAQPDLVKLDLEKVFVVSEGYDTNDNVEITFLAKLPSACFKPNKHKLSKIDDFNFHLDFSIKRKDISSCREDSNSVQVNNPIYYTETISLGELKAGDYQVSFNRVGLSKRFKVVPAVVGSIDDFLYAPVTSVFIPEMTYFTSDAKVILSGIIQSSCMVVFNRNISVTRVDDIFVITPKAKLISDNLCERVEVPLQQIVSLGSVNTEGAYLIHVRSQSGLSVNKVFHVREQQSDQNGDSAR